MGKPRLWALNRRLPYIVGLVLLFLAGYWAATRIAVLRGPDALVDTATSFDALVPYLPATWPLYWVAYPFIVIGGGLALCRLPERRFRRAVIAIAGMTLAGVLIQIGFPARAPWPPQPTTSQRLFHDSALILPYATLPSMHVAYTAMAGALLGEAFPGRLIMPVSLALVLAVAIATLTLREHVMLDAVAGWCLAHLAIRWWQRDSA